LPIITNVLSLKLVEEQPQILRLRLPQKARQTPLRTTILLWCELWTRDAGACFINGRGIEVAVPQGLKPLAFSRFFGTTKVVPFHDVLFEDVPFHDVPFHDVSFRDVLFRNVPFATLLMHPVPATGSCLSHFSS
jgi:hypothetical protein